MKITLTADQILTIADFAGFVIDEEKSYSAEDKELFLETEYVLSEKLKVESEDSDKKYDGLTIHLAEYPEEGFLPLELPTTEDK